MLAPLNPIFSIKTSRFVQPLPSRKAAGLAKIGRMFSTQADARNVMRHHPNAYLSSKAKNSCLSVVDLHVEMSPTLRKI